MVFSKFILFLILIFLIILSCEDKKEDTTPPTVTITSPQNNETVSGLVKITCMATDNEGIAKVELWVDGDTEDANQSCSDYVSECVQSCHDAETGEGG